jgi:hypothetical protein
MLATRPISSPKKRRVPVLLRRRLFPFLRAMCLKTLSQTSVLSQISSLRSLSARKISCPSTKVNTELAILRVR